MKQFLKGVIDYSITNKVAIFFLTAVMIVSGVVAFMNTPIETFPDVTNTNVIIITQWPGRSSEEIERFVSIPLETEMNSVTHKASMRSISLFGLSVLTLIFEDGVQDFNARVEVANHLPNVDLPDGANAEVEPPYGPTGEIFRYTLRSQTKDVTELKTIQDWVIIKRLKSVPGIADVVSFGGKIKTIEVSLDPKVLAKYNFTAIDVYDALKASNINVGGDVIQQGSQSLVVRGIGMLKNTSDVENVIINNIGNVPIKIKDVATVREGFEPRLGIVGRDNIDDVVEGIVLMRKGENPNDVLPNLRDKINEINRLVLPPDVQIDVFYDRSRLNEYTLHTVGENVILGITLVTIIVLVFLANWRTTVIVAIVIPLALLFAFICIRIKGMTANLLSIGAIDFGIIIDGAVVMVEGIFVMLAHRAHTLGMEAFNKRAKLSWTSKTALEMGKSIFTSKVIIITALLPIFAFQKVEGKLFSPLAYTIGFALMGSLIISLTLIPMLCTLLLKKNIRERENPFIDFMYGLYRPAFNWVQDNVRKSLAITVGAFLLSIFIFFKFIGSEFLPGLNEGSIYVRATMPLSISLEDSYAYTQKFRKVFQKFSEVRGVMSQTGRPDDGTDPTGFFNIEFFVDLYQKAEWKENITKEQLVNRMQDELSIYKGVVFNFSQPISDNVEEAVSGVKGSMAIKIFGSDLNILDQKADSVFNIMKTIEGVEDLGVFRNLGQPEYRIELDQQKLAQFNVSAEVCQGVVEMAIGGKTVSEYYEGERKFAIKVRYDQAYRYDEDQIENLLVPTRVGTKIPLKELAEGDVKSGAAFIYRQSNERFIALKFSVRGRDLGSTIKEAQDKVHNGVSLPQGYSINWAGEFENKERAEARLKLVMPISICLIFLILLFTFRSAIDAGIIILNAPFAIIGGILSLYFRDMNFSISAGVGFIALFGIAIQDGIILVNRFKENLHAKMNIQDAVRNGAFTRVRPVLMTALMAMLGLLPAALSTGIGSETQKPLATVVIGGLITSTLLTLLILPSIFKMVYSKKAS
jgi:cobalt-zinc-cadmium resistance protein CzcA